MSYYYSSPGSASYGYAGSPYVGSYPPVGYGQAVAPYGGPQMAYYPSHSGYYSDYDDYPRHHHRHHHHHRRHRRHSHSYGSRQYTYVPTQTFGDRFTTWLTGQPQYTLHRV